MLSAVLTEPARKLTVQRLGLAYMLSCQSKTEGGSYMCVGLDSRSAPALCGSSASGLTPNQTKSFY